MLTSFDDEEGLLDAIMAGVSGLCAQADPGFGPGVGGAHGRLGPVHARPEPAGAPAEAPELAGLSPRERGILGLIGDSLTNREIDKRLHLSEKTVKNRISCRPNSAFSGACRR